MKQILLFDRAMLVRMRIREVLESDVIKIYEVESESEVFAALQKHKGMFDLIIMDVTLDTVNGFDVVRKIKEIEHNVPVVILTASNKRIDFIKSVQAGASDYILKPFEDDFFITRIMNVLNNTHEFRKLPSATPATPAITKTGMAASDKPIKKTEKMAHHFQEAEEFPELLNAEVYKARKGKYPLTVFALIFEIGHKQPAEFSEQHFADIRAQLWQSDEIVPMDSHTFYGILPFCHEAGFHRFKEKMNLYLNVEAEEKAFYQQYKWHVVGLTVTNPEYDSLDSHKILELLKLETNLEMMNPAE